VREQLQEVVSFLQSDASAWEDAARSCERLAANLKDREQAEYLLLCVVYRERAKIVRERVAALRNQTSNASRAFRDSGQCSA
jgi:methylphosphotriester-DNA--protein-cysteine methyltransferase